MKLRQIIYLFSLTVSLEYESSLEKFETRTRNDDCHDSSTTDVTPEKEE